MKITIQEARLEQFHERISDSAPAFSNGCEIPDHLPRYLIVDCCSGGEEIWFYFADTLIDAASEIDESDTSRDEVKVFDLDTPDDLGIIQPIFKTIAFLLNTEPHMTTVEVGYDRRSVQS